MNDEFQADTLKKLTRIETLLEPLVAEVAKQRDRIDKVERWQFRLGAICAAALTVLAAAGQGVAHVIKAAVAAISQG